MQKLLSSEVHNNFNCYSCHIIRLVHLPWRCLDCVGQIIGIQIRVINSDSQVHVHVHAGPGETKLLTNTVY